MSYEKSCGAVIFRNKEGSREYLLILNRKGAAAGHWGFPKGHVEGNETETETAKREIMEETGVSVRFIDGFREVNTYSPRDGVMKDAVYFLAEATSGEVQIQQSEIAEYRWCSAEQAKKLLINDYRILSCAEEHFKIN